MHILAQTPRFCIRNFKPEEEDLFVSLFDDEQVTLHLPIRSEKEYREIFQNALTDYNHNKALGRWGIFSNSDNELIGMCLLRGYYNHPDKVELGYVLHKKYWGKGLGSEMVLIMLGYGLMNTSAKEVVAVTTLTNTASQKVLEKAGFCRMANVISNGEELAYFCIARA